MRSHSLKLNPAVLVVQTTKFLWKFAQFVVWPLSMRWLREAANKRSENPCLNVWLVNLEAAEGRGGAMKKRDEVHRMAEANKAFSHFRF